MAPVEQPVCILIRRVEFAKPVGILCHLDHTAGGARMRTTAPLLPCTLNVIGGVRPLLLPLSQLSLSIQSTELRVQSKGLTESLFKLGVVCARLSIRPLTKY